MTSWTVSVDLALGQTVDLLGLGLSGRGSRVGLAGNGVLGLLEVGLLRIRLQGGSSL